VDSSNIAYVAKDQSGSSRYMGQLVSLGSLSLVLNSECVAGKNINSSSALRGMDGLVDVDQTSIRLR